MMSDLYVAFTYLLHASRATTSSDVRFPSSRSLEQRGSESSKVVELERMVNETS